ncbi:hypothetical protein CAUPRSCDRAFT_11013 [Caulochytrium protostelioides]|uniref:Uncharacterized protein n=1 Tax=Caulochytrium protostelioides TaxID=1555241 RepID=A0A4P9WYF5_9FUNG|nr:hypothetical protein CAUPRSCDRAFT_11013 [Caulochytrium protostelioides]
MDPRRVLPQHVLARGRRGVPPAAAAAAAARAGGVHVRADHGTPGIAAGRGGVRTGTGDAAVPDRRVVRPVAAGETRTDGALVFEADFQAALQASARPPPADTTRGALHGTGHRQNEPDVQDSIRQRFADVLATLPPTTATLSSAQLEHAGLTQDDAQTLVADGFLILVNDGVYGITIRGGGRYWSHLDKGCEEVTRVLRRRVKISGIAEAVSSTIP